MIFLKNKIKDYIALMRVYQWYKNVIIFLPLFFSGNLFSRNIVFFLLGFFALSFISSSSYILNDFKDLKEDKVHPEKKNRPLASGRVTNFEAIILFLICFLLGSYLSFKIGIYFLYSAYSLFILTLLYTYFLKNIAFLDIIIISLNFVIRVISGGIILMNSYCCSNFPVSSWLILSVFFLALFLTSSKRESELIYLGTKAKDHKKSLKDYNLKMTQLISMVSMILLLTSYSFYLIFTKSQIYLITLPISLYILFRFYSLLEKGDVISRRVEFIYKDIPLFVSILLWVLIFFILLYVLKL